MDISSAASWFPELEMEDPLLYDSCDFMETFEEELAAVFGEDYQNSYVSETNSSSSSIMIPTSSSSTTMEAPPPPPPPHHHHHQVQHHHQVGVVVERPNKQQKPNSYSPRPEQVSSAPIILSFGSNNNSNLSENNNNSNDPMMKMTVSDVALSSFHSIDEAAAKGIQVPKKTSSRTRPPSQTYDHIIAERKRREQLSQRFVALSAIVPGLKKMDKTSVLGDAIKYLKHLQERVNTLEEQATKQTMESVVLVKKSQLCVEDEGSSDENFSGAGTSSEEALPEIEARVCDKHVLLRIHCEKQKGVLVKLLSQIENLNLSVINTSVSPFGTLALDVTIIAEMEKDYSMTVKDLVRNLRSTLQNRGTA